MLFASRVSLLGSYGLRLALVVAVGVTLVASACGSSEDDSATNATVRGQLVQNEILPEITLAVNDWTASAINVAIAEQLIEGELGYPVTAQRVDNVAQMLKDVDDSEIDAVLEIWPSTLTESELRLLDQSSIVDLGPLGPQGRIGWFTPDYVVEQEPALASWEGWTSQEELLGIAEDYNQDDQAIIDRLGLPLTLVMSGSEGATVEAFHRATEAEEPILAYWWTPTAAVARYRLVEVTLPEGTYPVDDLLKVAAPSLEQIAPAVFVVLGNLTITAEDQMELLDQVENEGVPIDRAAEEWLEANRATWQTWFP